VFLPQSSRNPDRHGGLDALRRAKRRVRAVTSIRPRADVADASGGWRAATRPGRGRTAYVRSLGGIMVARKVTLDIGGAGVDQSPPAVFERGTTSSGGERLVLDVPDHFADLFGRLCERLPPPFYVLYILHTPRGEGEAGRYQSTELSQDQLSAFLRRYGSYLSGDARHDLWVYSITSRQTLIWDRHNRLFGRTARRGCRRPDPSRLHRRQGRADWRSLPPLSGQLR
jgi:hypothetical protein